jgi:hypothetical protein
LQRTSFKPWRLALPAAAAELRRCNRYQAAFLRSHGELNAFAQLPPLHDPAVAALTSCHLVPQVM